MKGCRLTKRQEEMRTLCIKERQAGDVSALDLEGNITIGGDNATLHSAVRRLLADNKLKILLNLAGIQRVDSSGLGALIAAYTTVTRAGGQIKLLHVSRNIQDIMAITKLSTVFDVYDDELVALDSFTFGEQYEVIPYDGELVPRDTPEANIYAWIEPSSDTREGKG